MKKYLSFIFAATFSIFGILTAAAPAKSILPASQVVVVSTTGDALVIWDASVFINELATKKVSNANAMAQIEATAGKLLIEKAKTFHPSAKSVTVKVLYAPTQLAELYKSATFSGFNKLLLVTATRATAVAKADAWVRTLDEKRMPAGVTVAVVGTLPKQ